MRCSPIRRDAQKLENHLRYFSREHWRDRIADLPILLRPIAFKEVVVGEGLQPGRLSYSQATALGRIVMDVVMPVLLDVGNHGRCRIALHLHTKSVEKWDGIRIDVDVVGQQQWRKVPERRGVFEHLRITRCKHVSVQVRQHVASALMLDYTTDALVQQPIFKLLMHLGRDDDLQGHKLRASRFVALGCFDARFDDRHDRLSTRNMPANKVDRGLAQSRQPLLVRVLFFGNATSNRGHS